MKKAILTICCTLSVFSLKAQTNLAPLFSMWQDSTQSDSLRANAFMNYIGRGFLYSDPDSAIKLCRVLYDFGVNKKFVRAQYDAYNLQGLSFGNKGEDAKALNSYKKALVLALQAEDTYTEATLYNNMGGIYMSQGDYLKALDFYNNSLTIIEKLGVKGRVAGTLGNIGIIYKHQEDYPMALKYLNRAKEIAKQNEDYGSVARQLVNIGTVYKQIEKEDMALANYDTAIKLFDDVGDKYNKVIALNNIGSIHHSRSEYDKALKYYNIAFEVAEIIGDKGSQVLALNNLGSVFENQGKFNEAREHCLQSLSISQENGFLTGEQSACECLYNVYKALGNNEKTLYYIERLTVIEDSINSREIGKKLQQMEFAKQISRDSLAAVEKENLLRQTHEKDLSKKNRTRDILISLGLILVVIVLIVFTRLRFVRKSKANLQIEKERSENILHNILPEEIAKELKETGKADARDFDMVSILFTDFKEFTQTSEKLSAKDLMSEVNICFEKFDGIMMKYGIEKIKTIGDAYMAAGGLTVIGKDSVKNTVMAALEMQDFISHRKVLLDSKGLPAFEMRVGVHTGPVVAGIVGVKKFQYDIWGDTVNIASRMESAGAVKQVNISAFTYEKIKDDNSFQFHHRGEVEVKGKGAMEMWFVTSNNKPQTTG